MRLAAEPFTTKPGRRPGGVFVVLAFLWFGIADELSARAATGLASGWLAGVFVPLLRPAFLLFLVVIGVALLDGERQRSSLRVTTSLPQRSTAAAEWSRGIAIGWGAAVLAVLPFVFARRLVLSFWTEPRGWCAAVITVIGAALATLAGEIVFRGYGLRRLRERYGSTSAVLFVGVVCGVGAGYRAGDSRTALLAFLFSLLLATCWLRTHAIWLSWGLHFAWNISLGLLFGMRAFDGGDLTSVVQAHVRGQSRWLGGVSGPIDSWWTLLVLLLGLAVLVGVTRDFAWRYTHREIVAAGFPMDVKPPEAHTAMEQTAPAPPLIQILPAAPSASPVPRGADSSTRSSVE